VGFFFYVPFQVLSVLFTKATNSTRERERERERQTGRHGERGRGRESARACARLSEHLVSVPAETLSARRGVGMRESLLGPCSLLMVARARAHTHTVHTRTDDKRGSGSRHAQRHRSRTQTHRRPPRAACERMRQLPVSQKTNAVSVPSPPPLP
jgi:hypothetical protein